MYIVCTMIEENMHLLFWIACTFQF